MADPQDRSDSESGADPAPPGHGAPSPPEVPKLSTPPAKKVPAKKISAEKGAKKSPGKKLPGKKAAARKAPATKAESTTPKVPDEPVGPQRIDTNGQLTAAAKDAAAQAKSAVEAATNPVAPDTTSPPPARFPVPLVLAVAIGLLTALLIRQLRRGCMDEA